jgi:DNA-binding NarL/FixJ family response regulator
VIARELAALRGQAAMSEAALDGLLQPAFVVSPTAALLLANQAAERQLRAGVPFEARHGRLVAAARGSAARLEAAIRAATALRHRSASDWAERASDGSNWIVRVLPMQGDSGCALVYLRSTDAQLASTSVLERLFSLTAAEADIARQLASGLSVKEIAYARGVSELTVRSQVRAVLTKTGARRLSGLQALVRSVPLLSTDLQ